MESEKSGAGASQLRRWASKKLHRLRAQDSERRVQSIFFRVSGIGVWGFRGLGFRS